MAIYLVSQSIPASIAALRALKAYGIWFLAYLGFSMLAVPFMLMTGVFFEGWSLESFENLAFALGIVLHTATIIFVCLRMANKKHNKPLKGDGEKAAAL